MCDQFTQEIFEVFRCFYLTFYMKYKLHKNTPFQNILRFTNKNKDKTRFFISLTGPEASTSLTTQLFF